MTETDAEEVVATKEIYGAKVDATRRILRKMKGRANGSREVAAKSVGSTFGISLTTLNGKT